MHAQQDMCLTNTPKNGKATLSVEDSHLTVEFSHCGLNTACKLRQNTTVYYTTVYSKKNNLPATARRLHTHTVHMAQYSEYQEYHYMNSNNTIGKPTVHSKLKPNELQFTCSLKEKKKSLTYI